MREVLVAAAAPSRLRNHLFHYIAHVRSASGRLSEHQGRRTRRRSEERDCSIRGNLLREHLRERQVAVGDHPPDDARCIYVWDFADPLSCVQLGQFLTDAGFTIEAQFGGFEREALTPASAEIVTIARPAR